MKIVLLKELARVGKEGQTVEVKNGYARNYLIPRGLALVATENNLKKLEMIKQSRLKAEQKMLDKVLKLKEALENTSLTLVTEVKKDEEIYGSIGETRILKALKEEGIELEHKKILLEDPIKKLGVYNLKVVLHPNVEANLKIWVVKK